MATNKGWIGELHLRARVENGKLADEQILCPACGNSAKSVTAYDAGGAPTALLVCSQCGKRLAEFATDAEMQKYLAEIWRGARPYLLRPPRKAK
jgi:hypothetical protein